MTVTAWSLAICCSHCEQVGVMSNFLYWWRRSMVADSANDYLFCLTNLISLIGDSRLVLRTIFGQI